MKPDSGCVCRNLKAALLRLPASGGDGFEGLVRDAYREVTGISLSLQKAGPQGGADAVPPAVADEVAAAIEAKRYRTNTPLSLDDLKAKLLDAATRSLNPVELWILCATKEISGDDAAELQRIGDQHGIGTLILDWKSDDDPLAPLPLLLALAPKAVARHLSPSVSQSLGAIHEHPEFAAQKARLLDRLTSPDLGLSYAAQTARRRIEETLHSRSNAKSRLQNPVDLAAPSRIWEPRDDLCERIFAWAERAAEIPVCALLGEEGTGKTWLMFDWWLRPTDTATPPLIVWLSAREVPSGALSEIIGTALAKWVTSPRRDAAFWARRLELWCKTRPSFDRPIVWLMLDAANEGVSQQEVMDALSQSIDSDWKGKIGILLSDRPTHWERVFKNGKWLTTAVVGGVSLAMLIAGFASPRVGKIIQARGGRPMLAFSAVTFAAGLAIMGLAPVLPVYLAAWVLSGFGMASGLYDPAFATLGRIYGQAARPMITAVTLFGGFASTVCWPVTALLLESFGWRWACFAYAAAHFFLALPAYLLLLPARAPELVAADPADRVKSALPANKEVTALWVVGVILTTSGAMLALVSIHLLALLQARGLELAAAVAFGALVGPSQVAARVVELTFGRFYHPLWTMLVGVSLVTIGVLLLWMDVPVIAAALITYGAGNGIISITRGSVPLVLFGSNRFAITMGRLALPSLLAMAAAPTIGTLLIENGGASLTFLVLTLASALNVALALVLIVGFRR